MDIRNCTDREERDLITWANRAKKAKTVLERELAITNLLYAAINHHHLALSRWRTLEEERAECGCDGRPKKEPGPANEDVEHGAWIDGEKR